MPDYLIKHRIKSSPVELLSHVSGPFETLAEAEADFAKRHPGSEVISAIAPIAVTKIVSPSTVKVLAEVERE